jgi:PEGA domain/Curli production assembly/transport component CsgG
MKPRSLISLCLTALAVSTFAQTNNRINLAVNDLQGKGLEQSTAGILSDRLRAELVNTGTFRVMERAEMESILKEQGFQKSGTCDEASCLVEVGQMLGVDRMIAGSVGLIGGLYTITLRMIDVAKGEILFVVSEDCECPVKEVVSKTLVSLAQKTAAKAREAADRSSYASRTGDLYLSSDPVGATVTIDNKSYEGATPLSVKKIQAGEHRIAMQKGELTGSQTVLLKPDDLLKVTLTLVAGKSSIKIFSEPAGASVTVDGSSGGVTPLKIDEVASGSHILIIEKASYLPVRKAVTLQANAAEEISVDLQPCGYLTLSVTPSYATIVLNGKDTIKSNDRNALPVGIDTVAISSPEFEPVKKGITIARNLDVKENVALTWNYASLSVATVPDSASVSVNGKSAGMSPYAAKELDPGAYALLIKKETYKDVTEQVVLAKGDTKKLSFNLAHTDEFLKLQKRKKQNVIWSFRGGFGAAALGFCAAGVYYNKKFNDYDRTYSSITTIGDHSAEWNNVQTAENRRNLMYSLAGVCSGAFVITLFFQL